MAGVNCLLTGSVVVGREVCCSLGDDPVPGSVLSVCFHVAWNIPSYVQNHLSLGAGSHCVALAEMELRNTASAYMCQIAGVGVATTPCSHVDHFYRFFFVLMNAVDEVVVCGLAAG